MKYFKPKLTLSNTLRSGPAQNLTEREMMLKHLENYRKGDKMAKLFSPITGNQAAISKLTIKT